MREMILLYLLGHAASMLVMCAVCVKWAREVSGPLRTGLRLIMAGALIDAVGFVAAKCVAVAARWAGHDLDFLSTTVAPPLASLAALLCSAGYLLPSAVAQWRAWADHRRLAPLWDLVRSVSTAQAADRLVAVAAGAAAVARGVHPRRAAGPRPLLRPPRPATGPRLRPARGTPPHQARLAAEAAMLTDAARRAAAREEPPESAGSYRLHATEVSGTGGLVELAQALHRPPSRTSAHDGAAPSSFPDP
ncbi:hypothetical protein ACFQV4_07250 [Streptomyces thermocarboxydus]